MNPDFIPNWVMFLLSATPVVLNSVVALRRHQPRRWAWVAFFVPLMIFYAHLTFGPGDHGDLIFRTFAGRIAIASTLIIGTYNSIKRM